MDVYSDVFRLGSGLIETSPEVASGMTTHKANPIVLGSFGGVMRRRILCEDTFGETLAEFQGADWAITNGITYWGKANTGEAQSKMCAMVFDLDGYTDDKFGNFLFGCFNEFKTYPVPQYVVGSGRNVHLYYVLDEPVSLYPGAKSQLKELKYALTDKIWNRYTSEDEHVQHQGINQGFRLIGGRTKDGGVVRAWRLPVGRTDVGYLNGFVPEASRADLSRRYRQASMTLEEAARRYPDWYERVVVGGESRPRRAWPVKVDLYEWWKRKVREGATSGHRYFCLMALAIFAVKCGIEDRGRVEADMRELVPFLDSLDPKKPFGRDREVESALECFDLRYVTFPRRDIEKVTAIAMPPNKRNGRKRAQHMAVMRAIQNVTDPDGTWRNRNGAPTKRDLVRAYAAEHPGESQRAIAKALGVSPTTVNKWLKGD